LFYFVLSQIRNDLSSFVLNNILRLLINLRVSVFKSRELVIWQKKRYEICRVSIFLPMEIKMELLWQRRVDRIESAASSLTGTVPGFSRRAS